MIVDVSKGVKKNFDVVLVEIAALEVRMLVCFFVRDEFHHLALFVRKEFICSNRLIFVIAELSPSLIPTPTGG